MSFGFGGFGPGFGGLGPSLFGFPGSDGFGCGRCEACVGGYGDGPCGGYYSFWERYGLGRSGRGPGCGCFEPCREHHHECECREHNHDCECRERHECCCRPRNECCRPRRPSCPGLFITIPCGCFNIGFFL
jgi:hypothetical protein